MSADPGRPRQRGDAEQMLRAGFAEVLARLDQLSERIAALEDAIGSPWRPGLRPASPARNQPPSTGELLSHDPFGAVAPPPEEPPPGESAVPDSDLARRVWTNSEDEAGSRGA